MQSSAVHVCANCVSGGGGLLSAGVCCLIHGLGSERSQGFRSFETAGQLNSTPESSIIKRNKHTQE
jgi:hypothetical protein